MIDLAALERMAYADIPDRWPDPEYAKSLREGAKFLLAAARVGVLIEKAGACSDLWIGKDEDAIYEAIKRLREVAR